MKLSKYVVSYVGLNGSTETAEVTAPDRKSAERIFEHANGVKAKTVSDGRHD